MADVFNAEEVLEMACQIERNGARYYRRAADLMRDDKPRRLLKELALMEDEHEATFETMRADLSKRSELLGNADELAVMYLKSMADGYVFPVDTDPAEELTEETTLDEILRHAIGMEKDSIVFYLGIRDAMSPALGKERVEHVIREEMRHVALLSERLSEVARGEA